MKRVLIVLALACSAAFGQTQISGDVLGSHNLSLSGSSPTKGALDPCTFCHAPHSGVVSNSVGLWSQTLSTQQNYQLYSNTTSKTMSNTTLEPTLGGHSNLCLSCHDGSVAVGETMPYGQIHMSGSMNAADIFGSNLQASHPISLKLPLVDSPDLVSTLLANGTTKDPLGQVKLINGNIECSSCHSPHVEGIDRVAANFMVIDSSKGQLCLACHEVGPRTVNSVNNPLQGWTASIHNTAGNTAASKAAGSYATVAQNACSSCHVSHNALPGAKLLRPPSTQQTNMDSATQDCVNCHNGGSNISPAIPNVYAEFAKKGHPFALGTNTHDASETTVLNNNRHSTCVDCHNPHTSLQVATFNAPPVIRVSQAGIAGVNATDGTSVLNPAINQYENCLRCHGTSTGKPTTSNYGYMPLRNVGTFVDAFNVLNEFGSSDVSTHPVMRDRSSTLPQPSLLLNMWNLNGQTQGRAIATRVFCTDCHNSDDNREFGGAGPNGPHGSQYDHILERRYEISYVAPATAGGGPGSLIQNLFPNPVLTPDCSVATCSSPYAMCAKCHDLTNVMANASFNDHANHINAGFSCSVCHTSHGMTAESVNPSGMRLVDFDMNVVAPNAGAPVAYLRDKNTCVLACHGYNHNADGSVTAGSVAAPAVKTGVPK